MKSILLIITIFLFVNCHSSVEESTNCGQPNGKYFKDIQGRVYRFSSKFQNSEYYLGTGVDKPRGGGMIPCSNLPTEFQVDGLDIVWSGFDKGTLSDVGDPLFGFVALTKIEKAN